VRQIWPLSLKGHNNHAAARRASEAVVADAAAGDELSRKIYASCQQFRAPIMDWHDAAERAFLNSRRHG
jgi:TRAP-type mannitol/chloroaromatic compound transport system substrate-binding protein